VNVNARRNRVPETASWHTFVSGRQRKNRQQSVTVERRGSDLCPPERILVIVACENRPLREALIRILGQHSRMDVREVDLNTADHLKILTGGKAKILLLGSGGLLTHDLRNIQKACGSAPNIRILLLCMTIDEVEFSECVRAGVKGYLRQDASGEEVLRAVEAVAAGAAVCPGSLCGVLFRNFKLEPCS